MENSTSNIIKLKSSDGEIFEIKEKCFLRSNYYKIIKDISNPNEEIPLKEVDSKALVKIIEYLNHYENEDPKEIPKPMPSPDLKQFLSEWDYNYIILLSIQEIVNLINAANYLNIKELVNLCSARLASEMTNCPIEEAREKFGIVADMTQEEADELDKYPLE